MEQAKSVDSPRRSFDAIGIVDRAPEHLIAATDAEDAATAAHMRDEIDVPAVVAKRSEIGDRRFRAGQQDKIANGQRLAAPDKNKPDGRLAPQGREIHEI